MIDILKSPRLISSINTAFERFQNIDLVDEVAHKLESNGISVYTNKLYAEVTGTNGSHFYIDVFTADTDIACMTVYEEDFESIVQLYSESIDDFDESCLRRLSSDRKIANIDDFYIYTPHRGEGYAGRSFELCLDKIRETLNDSMTTFVLRAYPDTRNQKGLNLEDLVGFYKKHGFTVAQETEEDGVIMYMRPTNRMNESRKIKNLNR